MSIILLIYVAENADNFAEEMLLFSLLNSVCAFIE